LDIQGDNKMFSIKKSLKGFFLFIMTIFIENIYISGKYDDFQINWYCSATGEK
jgi:hypothetical protein